MSVIYPSRKHHLPGDWQILNDRQARSIGAPFQTERKVFFDFSSVPRPRRGWEGSHAGMFRVVVRVGDLLTAQSARA